MKRASSQSLRNPESADSRVTRRSVDGRNDGGPAGTNSLAGLSDLDVVPARHPWRVVAAVATLVVVAMFVNGLFTNDRWDWGTFRLYFLDVSVMKALVLTLELTVLSAVFGFIGGTILATMRLSNNPVLQAVSWSYVWLFRSIPLIVQLLFWGNLSYLYSMLSLGVPFGPEFFSFKTLNLLDVFTAAVVGLTLHESAYFAEIVRSGVLSVDQGQSEASSALGIPKFRHFRRILLPQAMRSILPNAANQLISLIKGTSVVYVLAIGELFYQVQVIYGRNGRIVALLMVATVWYLILVTILSIFQFYVEQYFSRGAVRTVALTPMQRLKAALRSKSGVRR